MIKNRPQFYVSVSFLLPQHTNLKPQAEWLLHSASSSHGVSKMFRSSSQVVFTCRAKKPAPSTFFAFFLHKTCINQIKALPLQRKMILD